jgi:hypothetical protein
MQLSAGEITALRARHAQRRNRLLRRAFARASADPDRRGRYFDAFHALAQTLPGMGDADVLLLLEIGYRQDQALDACFEYRTALTRGQWYGRRLWLRDRAERLGIDPQTIPAPPAKG